MTAPQRLNVLDVTPEQDIAAGRFGDWLDAMRHALAADGGMAVPCGSCSACCRSSYFVHIGGDETDALAHVPPELLFPAPGGNGDRVIGFDQHGQCPMLTAEGCSIYPHRPLTCRRYDCRVFSAAGLDPAADDKAAIADRARRWRFTHADEKDRRRHLATAAAARFLLEHGAALGRRDAPANLTQVAVLAVRIQHLFEAAADPPDAAGRPHDVAAVLAAVRAVLDNARGNGGHPGGGAP